MDVYSDENCGVQVPSLNILHTFRSVFSIAGVVMPSLPGWTHDQSGPSPINENARIWKAQKTWAMFNRQKIFFWEGPNSPIFSIASLISIVSERLSEKVGGDKFSNLWILQNLFFLTILSSCIVTWPQQLVCINAQFYTVTLPLPLSRWRSKKCEFCKTIRNQLIAVALKIV